MRRTRLTALLMAAAVLAASHCSHAPAPVPRAGSTGAALQNREPNWPVCTPEEQGVDSGTLLTMFETIQKEDRKIHSVLIIRRGKLLVEAYFHPYTKDHLHIIYSATKSISSLLVGIALKEGFVPSLDTPILDLFPEYANKVENLDGRKESLALEHVLSMTDGLDWMDMPYHVKKQGDFLKLLASDDGVKYYLDKPMKEEPGKRYNYNSGSAYMLSALIQETTGRSALDYGREKLFQPLGIAETGWGRYANGIDNGGSELFLRPRDFAAIGCLLLNGGKWDGRQVVPAEWVNELGRPRAKTDFLEYGYSLTWYVDETLPEKSISAQGLGGQYLFVIPGLDMVVVFTGGLIGRDEIDIPFYYLRDYILPSVRSEGELPANPSATARLDSMLREFAEPPAKPVAPLPRIAEEISGRTFFFPERDIQKNIWGLETASLHFDTSNECRIRLTFSGNVEWFSLGFDAVFRSSPGASRLPALEAIVGLDDVCRTVVVQTDTCDMPYSAKGKWKDERTFEVTSLSGWSVPETHTFEFQPDGAVAYTFKTIFYGNSLRGERMRTAGDVIPGERVYISSSSSATSYAPRSNRAFPSPSPSCGRGLPSKSDAGAFCEEPASMAGEPPSRWKSPLAGLMSRGSASM